MVTEIHISLFDLFIFLGVFMGIFLSWFFIKNGKKDNRANLYQGLLLLFLSLGMFEELLNNTGYIVQLLPLTNFAEPFNFTFAPLFYLYIRSSLEPNKKQNVWVHFILAVFWLFYMYFMFIQPEEVKYNSYIQTKHPDWEYLDVVMAIDDDPIGVRRYINQLTLVQFVLYLGFSNYILLRKFKVLREPVFRTNNEILIVLRNTSLHFLMILFVFVATKSYFGMRSDVGGYLISAYISFMILATSYRVLNHSEFFIRPASFLNFPSTKYQKSSLSEQQKDTILSKIRIEMEEQLYFTQNLASLSGLSKKINESSHHVSQVINEKLEKHFFELLAGYRVAHAEKLIREDPDAKLTVEELAEQVGYNSKSSFNTAFKKFTLKTPSEYRKSVSNS